MNKHYLTVARIVVFCYKEVIRDKNPEDEHHREWLRKRMKQELKKFGGLLMRANKPVRNDDGNHPRPPRCNT